MVDIKVGCLVIENILFEFGLVSKIFIGVVGEYVMQIGIMNFNDFVMEYVFELMGSQWIDVKMLYLVMYIVGGFFL